MIRACAFLILAVAAVLALTARAPGSPATGFLDAPLIAPHGTVTVFDGDSLEFNGRVINLFGIDAPELGQTCGDGGNWVPCGRRAAYALRKIVELERNPLACWPHDLSNGALVASCAYLSENLSMAMLAGGYAAARPGAPLEYHLAEEQARTAGLGIWKHPFEMPWEWRTRHGRSGAAVPAGDCVVIGIETPDGRRVYLGPLDGSQAAAAFGDAVKERRFCSDDQARDAGWRRPAETAPADAAPTASGAAR